VRKHKSNTDRNTDVVDDTEACIICGADHTSVYCRSRLRRDDRLKEPERKVTRHKVHERDEIRLCQIPLMYE
jgi:hypothetical protein